MANSSSIKNQITEWGIHPMIIEWFKKRGITSLFDWQVECLCKDDVLFGGNLVYSAPTSAGKTLVADFLLLKRVLEYGKKALVIEPFVALTREKAMTLKSMLYSTKARVGAFGGNYYTPGGMAAVSIAVCTIEKANNFINKLINEGKLGDLGIIVVDEIHYVGDERRGYQLELLLTKVLFYNSMQDKNKKIQIVGLSATIPNLDTLATWLRASLYVTSYRPVPLVEKIKITNRVYEVAKFIKEPGSKPLEFIKSGKYPIEKDYDDLCYFCLESIVEGHSNLVFCESKRECEILASNLSMQIKLAGDQLESGVPEHAEVSKKIRQNLSKAKIVDVVDKLKKCPAGPDKELIKSLSFGVAFHHAGLTSEEREIIEDGFKSGGIRTLMATSTLSSGVNLPARRVIIRSPLMISSSSGAFSKEMLNPTTYRQMIGRAGRKNIDTCGESILLCNPENQSTAIQLIKAALGHITSSLGHKMIASEGEPSGLKKAVLEVIANGTARTRIDLNQYLNSTFWFSQSVKDEHDIYMKAVAEALRFLVANKFIEELKPGLYRSTRLGNAVLASGLHPDESLELLQDLIKARQGFCLLNDLHIIYQVTPNDIARTVELKDWKHYSKIWHDLDDISQAVGQRVGIDDIVIARKCQGFLRSGLGEEKERIYRRFWVSLVINDLINEIPLPEICAKYQMSKAMVQHSQRTVAQFAGVLSIFCKELGYDNIAALVTPLESRVNFSCQRDLLELIKLNMTRPIARALFNAGYKNPIAVAKGDRIDIEFVLRNLKPFKKDHSFSLDSKDLPSMWVPELAKTMTILEYASHLVETARSYILIEYDIDLSLSPVVKRVEEKELLSDHTQSELESECYPSPIKRSRMDTGAAISGEVSSTRAADLIEDQEVMVRENKDVPNFVVKYIGRDSRDVDRYLNKWIIHNSISLNFKLAHKVNEPIGGKIKVRRRRKNSKTKSDEDDDSDEEPSSQNGLALRLDIDNKKHIVTRLYTCFDEDFTVYIVKHSDTMEQIRDKLCENLKNSYASALAQTASQQREDFIPINLYTQNAVISYKVLYAAFGLDEKVLNRHFKWHSFDVTWWMVNDCPNRGLNNLNSSLSLVAKTRWAQKYHHFLYQSTRKSRSFAAGTSSKRNSEKWLELKDIVKAGKTAILQPLVNEIMIELIHRNQTKSYFEAEIKSRLTMAQMMVHGMGIDMKTMRSELSLYDELSEKLTDIAQRLYAKSTISMTNIHHVARVLYEDLDLKQYLLNHATNADISKNPTNSEVLTILSEYHPFPKMVQDFRKIAKATEALQSVNTHSRFNKELDMVRVFGECDFWQLTGRVSMSDPDLFLINRNFSITLPAHGNRQEEVIECVPRKCFVPFPGWIFVSADYSQLELRLLAHFSGDKNLLDILNRGSEDPDESFDVFKTVASRVYQIPVQQVTTENRQHAKQICYGIIYGMGNKTLANQLGVDIEKAEMFRQDFFSAFPRILEYTEDLIKDCGEVGHVESLLGRRRVIDGINSEHSSLKSRAKRVAINTRIQSSASDLIKLAMNQVNERILENYVGNARLVLEMHDELIYEVQPVFVNKFSRMLKITMENLGLSEGLKVKLMVNVKKGPNWSILESFSPDNNARMQ